MLLQRAAACDERYPLVMDKKMATSRKRSATDASAECGEDGNNSGNRNTDASSSSSAAATTTTTTSSSLSSSPSIVLASGPLSLSLPPPSSAAPFVQPPYVGRAPPFSSSEVTEVARALSVRSVSSHLTCPRMSCFRNCLLRTRGRGCLFSGQRLNVSGIDGKCVARRCTNGVRNSCAFAITTLENVVRGHRVLELAPIHTQMHCLKRLLLLLLSHRHHHLLLLRLLLLLLRLRLLPRPLHHCRRRHL